MSTHTLTHDTPLTSTGAQGERTFMHELRELLNRHGVDNACGTPDYILADLLRDHLRTWRFYATARDLHAGYPSSLNTPQAVKVVATQLGAPFIDDLTRQVSDGFEEINQLAKEAREQIEQLRKTSLDQLQRAYNATEKAEAAAPFFDNKAAYTEDGTRFGLEKGGADGVR